MKAVIGVLVGTAIWLAPRAAAASSIPVVNFGFELPVGGDGGFTDEVIPGWVVDFPNVGAFAAGVYNPPAGEITPSEGVQVAYLGPFGQAASSISQILTATLQPSTTYTLRVDVGRRAGSPDAGFGLALLADGTILAAITNPFVLPIGTMSTATLVWSSPANLGSLGGTPLQILLFNTEISGQTFIGQTNYDNVRLDDAAIQAVPEPTVLLFVAVGLVSLAAVRFGSASL